MPELKIYQRAALDSLRDYFRECTRLNDPDTAFYTITKLRMGQGIPYRPVPGLTEMPYVCVRVPTGGGKTVMACHAIGHASHDLLQADRSLVLWLVPSNAIREQTIAALKDHQHFYRRELDTVVGPVTVMDASEALSLPRPLLDTATVIIVCTLQSFRVEETEGRKVYEQNGALMDHFTGLPGALLEHLEKYENGEPVYSLANVLRLRSPIVIVDEAHNARTELSFDTLARFRPACIVEFTATPDTQRSPSNIIHTVSAAELKAEEMIKLPVQLQTRSAWQELLTDAVAARDQLEQVARLEQQATGEYIRPILLIQAQPRRQNQPTVTVDVVRDALLNDHRIPAEQVKEATGDNNELYAIPDLASADCPVRFVITVQALREGWDCPFAYVLCTVAELRSSTAVEQILGRILRMPRAKRKQWKELNRAYAFATSSNFLTTAAELKDALVESGFNRQEVNELLATVPSSFSSTPPMIALWQPSVSATLTTPFDVSQLPPVTMAKVAFDDNTNAFTYTGPMSDDDRHAIAEHLNTVADQAALERLFRQSQGFSVLTLPTSLAGQMNTPAERGELFNVPLLSIRQGELFEQFEDTHFSETQWNLGDTDASLNEGEFDSERLGGQSGLVDINDQGQVKVEFLAEVRDRQMALALDRWTAGQLIYWLQRHIPHIDLDTEDMGRFLQRMLRSLMDQRGMSLEFLVHNKIRLRGAAEKKIQNHRQASHLKAYQALLLPDSPTPLTVTPEVCFTYDPNAYPYNALYRGPYAFRKHYYPQVGDLNDEEAKCAQVIDNLPQVELWVRNIERQPRHSFWLQTNTDRFYPDFVCKLKDGRTLVVEYKGADRWSNDDSREKRDLGELWEARSDGRCAFTMPKGMDFESIRRMVGS